MEFSWNHDNLSNEPAVHGPPILVTDDMVCKSVCQMKKGKVTGPSGFLLDIILASQQHIVPSALQIRAGQWSTIANLWPLNACDWWLFQEIFLSLILLFPRNSSK